MKAWCNSSPYLRVAICAFIFLLAFSVRSLTWHDTRFEVGKVQTSVAGDYQRVAELLRQEGLRGFFSSSSSLADLNNLGHPPGYSILIALVRAVFGNSQAAVQFTQIVFDSLAAVLLFLIVLELFSLAPATIAGLFAALSPQLAWNSVLLLPDSLATFPILLAVFLLARSREKPRLVTYVIIGVLVGISCWLRANAMVLAPFFAVAVLLLHGKKQWRNSLAVIAGTLLIVLPLTIRNAIATRHFIPVSLGAGQTLLEGIADYDANGRFGIPNTDMGIMKQEAEVHQRPEYYGTLFNPDGVQRERARMKRGVGVIASNPVWFASVMVRRAASMVRLERARLVSVNPPVTYPLHPVDESKMISSIGPENFAVTGSKGSPRVKTSLAPDGQTLTIIGDDAKYGRQFSLPRESVRTNTAYLYQFAIKIEKGRMRIVVYDGSDPLPGSVILEPDEGAPPEQGPKLIDLPFTTTNRHEAVLVLKNEASHPPPVVQIHSVKLYELGPVRHAWTRYPRLPIGALQAAIITAFVLPFAIIGLAVLVLRKQRAALVILSVVPLYYFTVQSAFHTEYRYVLAVNYFLFAFAAVAIAWVVRFGYRKVNSLSLWERVRVRA